MEVQFPASCVNGYLKWYLIVLHPCIIPHVKYEDYVGGHSDDMSPPPYGVDDQQLMQMISVIMDNIMGLVNLDGEVYTLISQAAHIARERPM